MKLGLTLIAQSAGRPSPDRVGAARTQVITQTVELVAAGEVSLPSGLAHVPEQSLPRT
jgi:hypothetical protein